MTSRSAQAHRLARLLTQQTGVVIELVYADAPDHWDVFWTDGPTRDHAKAMVTQLLDRFPAMADRRLTYSRQRSARAYAARAVAADRTGELAEATAQRLAYLTDLGLAEGKLSRIDYVPAEASLHHALTSLVDATDHPDRPSAPEDQALIDQLLATASGSEYHVIKLLLGGSTIPSLAHLPADELAARRHQHRQQQS